MVRLINVSIPEHKYNNQLFFNGEDMKIEIDDIYIEYFNLYDKIICPILKEYISRSDYNKGVHDEDEEINNELVLEYSGGDIDSFDYDSSENGCYTVHSFFFSIVFFPDDELIFNFRIDICFECTSLNNFSFDVKLADCEEGIISDYYYDVNIFNEIKLLTFLFFQYSKNEIKEIFCDFDLLNNESLKTLELYKLRSDLRKKFRSSLIKLPIHRSVTNCEYNIKSYIKILPSDVIGLINEYL